MGPNFYFFFFYLMVHFKNLPLGIMSFLSFKLKVDPEYLDNRSIDDFLILGHFFENTLSSHHADVACPLSVHKS